MQKNEARTRRIVTNAVMIGIYIALTYLTISMGGLKITFEHFPVIICAILFGPGDAMLVGGIGELVNQLFSFGLTPTTLLWVLPVVVRGGIIGCCGKLFEKQMSVFKICENRIPIVFGIVCILSGLIGSCFNTLAFYVDSKMFGYYSYALVFGAFLMRLVLSGISSILMCFMTKAVFGALRKGHLI